MTESSAYGTNMDNGGLNFNAGGDDMFGGGGDNDDIFAAAGVPMSNQGAGMFSNQMGGMDNDLTPEEKEQLAKKKAARAKAQQQKQRRPKPE